MALGVNSAMYQLQIATKTKNCRAERVEAANVIKSSPATISNPYRVKNGRLFRTHSQSAEISRCIR